MTLTSRREYERWRRKRRAVSPVIAELLLIVITVALGTLVYSFASTAFGGFGSGFSNLVQSAGAQLSEKIVVEQAYFYNTMANNSGCTAAAPIPSTCGGVLYVRNIGTSPVIIENIFMGNVTSPLSLPITTLGSASQGGPHYCTSNTMAPYTVCFTGNTPSSYDTQAGHADYDFNNVLGNSTNEIMPGSVAVIRFVLPDSSASCAVQPLNCVVAFGGTTYAFTLVTQRGNDFVAYETA